ncbi:unnamed protein product [Nesidiocoris tenuis]|uniref:Uncharacterized protein n=1 Tax=Nesidiocoris tenuis TaxID=355587 RepID=A0A6H5GDC7_9HEMI|nr:unnamed protein product [Nesidiocoris tenuis]
MWRLLIAIFAPLLILYQYLGNFESLPEEVFVCPRVPPYRLTFDANNIESPNVPGVAFIPITEAVPGVLSRLHAEGGAVIRSQPPVSYSSRNGARRPSCSPLGAPPGPSPLPTNLLDVSSLHEGSASIMESAPQHTQGMVCMGTWTYTWFHWQVNPFPACRVDLGFSSVLYQTPQLVIIAYNQFDPVFHHNMMDILCCLLSEQDIIRLMVRNAVPLSFLTGIPAESMHHRPRSTIAQIFEYSSALTRVSRRLELWQRLINKFNK